jgi:PBS lyase HEAT-like repeat
MAAPSRSDQAEGEPNMGLYGLIARCISVAILVNIAAVRAHPRAGLLRQSPSDEDRIASAIKSLWSSKEHERLDGKAEIIGFGTKSIPALLLLLEDLVRRPEIHRFALGKEEEGQKILSDQGKRTLFPDQVRQLLDTDISWRLEADACELLGRLRAREAVPLLLQIMERREIIDRIAAMNVEMTALVEIGRPAIPETVQLFESADSIAESIRFGRPAPSAEDQIRYKRGYAATIRARAAVVLGRIGDEQALPALETSLREAKPSEWRPDLPFIWEAIKKIREKSAGHTR